MPHGWELRGLVKGPREADPAIQGATWVAWATGEGQRVEGTHETAEGAMRALINELRALREVANG